jgi:hypothetical protein
MPLACRLGLPVRQRAACGWRMNWLQSRFKEDGQYDWNANIHHLQSGEVLRIENKGRLKWVYLRY